MPDQSPAGVSTVEYAMVYQAEKPRLMRYLIQCGAGWTDADDAAQRALMTLYEQWESVKSPRSWLRTVAFREFLKAKSANGQSLEEGDHLGAVPDRSGIELMLEQDTVLAAIRQLPRTQQQVFALHFDQFSHSEIAGILEITEAAARQNLARARARLKEILGLGGTGHHDG